MTIEATREVTTEAASARVLGLEAAIQPMSAAGVGHRAAEDDKLDGRHVTLDGRRMVNFGSCSYLGLELDPRLTEGACDAVARYGVIFSSSRAYLSAPIFPRYEALLSRVVGGLPVVVTPSTSLAHLAALPVLITERDAVLYDTMVHHSVQAVLPTLRELGIRCEAAPHNRLDRLEQRVRALAPSYERLFYLCDGVYGMHGDVCPLEQLFALLEREPKLHAYVDDAHGVGWAGRHGAGTVLGRHGIHPRMVVALGLTKGFGSGGGVLVFPSKALARRVFACGSTLIFSGPLQLAQLGAGVAAAEIMLSPELETIQRRVCERRDRFDALASERGLNVRVQSEAPIRFVAIGREEDALHVTRDLFAAGFFVNLAIFPAVPRRRAGIRVMFTASQSVEDVERLVDCMARSLHGLVECPPTIRMPLTSAP